MSRWKWVHNPHGKSGWNVLRHIGINPDGTLYNPNGYPEDLVREAVLAADAQVRKRRSAAAKEAAKTRRERTERRIYQIAKQMSEGGRLFPWHHCVICSKALDDFQSIKRGIGSECWQHVLARLEQLTPKPSSTSNPLDNFFATLKRSQFPHDAESCRDNRQTGPKESNDHERRN
jgi:hypothetical protein